MKPLFQGNLDKQYRECVKFKGRDVWACLRRLIVENMDDVVEREMGLCAHHLMDIVVDIAERGEIDIKSYHREALRSDEHALDCIREWDRMVAVPKILYRTFFLHACKIIAHLTGDHVKSESSTRMQMQLERTIDTDFPHRMMKEVRREPVSNGRLIFGSEDKRCRYRMVNEVRLLVAEQKIYKSKHIPVLYLENGTVYVSIDKNLPGKKPENFEKLLGKVKEEIFKGSLILKQNPMVYSFG